MKELHVSASPNIAFVKYWGKKAFLKDEDRNLPLNPSISLTLSKAKTSVKLSPSLNFEFVIQNQMANEKDTLKLKEHITRIENFLGHSLKPFKLDSSNNFPTGTGIASSASSYAALTCAFLAWDLGIDKVTNMLTEHKQSIADLARRGSGSACRSLHGPFVEWSEKNITLHASAWKLYDTIVIFSKKEKKVSSSDGHTFATQSPLFPQRLKEVPLRLEKIKKSIHDKNLFELGPELETEAEQMHQIMRENPNPIEYQLPETKLFLKNLKEIPNRDFFYTLDAGPNAHIISERPIRREIEELLKSLKMEAEIWEDEVGFGPQISLL